ncbi:MAG: enoyl-CoA hydratase/isomerase family protein [Gammaproteobacteria bacterium]|nr:enoyl-CoA hydratase/isomerase family protein [Gammaproteobacteria bacterium]
MTEQNWRNWRIRIDDGNIAWLLLDVAEQKVNVLSSDTIDELRAVLDQVQTDRPRGVVIASGKSSGFAAGADISEFVPPPPAAQVGARLAIIHEQFDRLARLSVPTVALIRGFCLGGGLELALACRYRVAAKDDPATRLGFPEVQLGLHPGAGGTWRSVQACGPLAAMNLMLTGHTIDASKAERIGLIDRAVPERHLETAARRFIQGESRPHRPPLLARLTGIGVARPVLAEVLRRQVRKQANPEHYPAPHALVELWRQHGGSARTMLRAERESFAQLLQSPQSQQLVRLFRIQERLKEAGRSERFSAPRVHVIGAGTMGGDIAAWCALRGCRVTLQDRGAKYLAPAFERAHKLYRQRIRDPRARQQTLDRLMPDLAGNGADRADIVIEAIVEDRDIKRALFAELEPRLQPEALLASNTSSIPLEQLAEGLSDPSRLVGLHFFNPVASMRLVEIISGRDTAATAANRAAAFAVFLDRLPVPVRSSPGFLINRILLPYMLEALHLVTDGVPAPVIDQTMRRFGMPLGPVELADTVGLDVCLSVARILTAQFGGEVPAILEQKVVQGRLGKKTQRGFYEYRNGRIVTAATSGASGRDAEITDRLLLRLLNEALACLREQVVADADLVDAGMVFGTGFAPFRGGPMAYLRSRGADELRARLHELSAGWGAGFRPDAGWDDPRLWQHQQEGPNE